jgi:copper resistance protein B
MAHGGMRYSAASRWFMLLAGLTAFPVAVCAQDGISAEIDLLEIHVGNGHDHLVLDSGMTVGTGADQLVIKVEGGSDTRTSFDDVEIQALYSRTLSDRVTMLAGVRYDIRDASNLAHASLGVVGDLGSGIEAEHYAFVSQHGNLTGSGQLIARWDIAPRLALEPRLALGWSAQDVLAEDLGSGPTDVEVSVRLRRSLGESLNIYTGVIHERLLGGTRDIAAAHGETAKVTRAIFGIGLSF